MLRCAWLVMMMVLVVSADTPGADACVQGGLMDHVFLRVGALATLRAMKLGSVTGCMVTASHNDEPDNGVKICEAGGDMMAESWEGYASELANLRGESRPMMRTRRLSDQAGRGKEVGVERG